MSIELLSFASAEASWNAGVERADKVAGLLPSGQALTGMSNRKNAKNSIPLESSWNGSGPGGVEVKPL
jgi:hypothetical protein